MLANGLSLDDIGSQAFNCQACNLAKGRLNVVFGVGNPLSGAIFIGEAPGAQEDELGLPFVGRSGKLLRELMVKAGLSIDNDLYLTNIVKCRPPGNRTPSRAEIDACSYFIDSQMAIIKPKTIVLIGSLALKSILKINLPISQIRGKWLDYGSDCQAMAIFHPAYLLRFGQGLPNSPIEVTLLDLRKIYSRIDKLKSI